MTYFIRLSEPTDYLRAVSIWHHALDAPHQFLAPHHKAIMKVEVAEFQSRKILWLAVDQENHAVGLMILREHQMDALFVSSIVHGVGIGKLLVQHAFRLNTWWLQTPMSRTCKRWGSTNA